MLWRLGKGVTRHFMGVFFVLFPGTINTPDHFWSGGHANILNKQHNSKDCSQPPDHFEFNSGGFFVVVMRPVLMTRVVIKIHSIQIRITTKI